MKQLQRGHNVRVQPPPVVWVAREVASVSDESAVLTEAQQHTGAAAASKVETNEREAFGGKLSMPRRLETRRTMSKAAIFALGLHSGSVRTMQVPPSSLTTLQRGALGALFAVKSGARPSAGRFAAWPLILTRYARESRIFASLRYVLRREERFAAQG